MYRENSGTATANGNFAVGFPGSRFSPTDFYAVYSHFPKVYIAYF